ncbi:MAG: PAS domain S-box protein [Gammaproteobacteria bacterium]|nr:PAS domain S-box protein [Gammaproteobacteria bacterium]
MKNKIFSQTIFENSPYALAVSDTCGAIIDVNPLYASLTGHSVEELCRLTCQDISANLASASFKEYIQTLKNAGKLGPLPDQYKHKNGHLLNVFVSATLLEDEGNNFICWFVDNTARIDASEAIQNHTGSSVDYDLLLNAAQAKSILKTAVDAIIAITREGIIHSINPAAEKMFGYAAEEVLGRNVSILMPEPYRSQHNSYISNYLNTGQGKIIGVGREALAQRKNGATFSVHIAISETNVDGMTLFTGIIGDITELKKAQQELENSEERFRRSQRFANIGTWDWNIKTGDLFWSERIPTLFGYNEGELQTNYDNFLRAVYPDDRQYVIDAVNNCVYQGEKYDIEHRCVWPDGTVRWMSERGDVIKNEHGEPSHMLGVVQDITPGKKAEFALLESEERFRGAFEYAAHGMAIVSLDGRWLKVNKSLGEIVGYSEQELLLTVFQTIIHPEDLEGKLSGLNQLVANEIEFFQSETRYIHKQSEIVWVLLSVSLVRDSSGHPLHFICQIIDITARKQAESELEKAKVQAENANQAKSEFLSSMSHELRTPLNAIVGFTELLQLSNNLDSQQLRDLGEIKKASYHLLELINDVLDLAKIESRQVELSMELVDLTEAVNQCCVMISQQAAGRNITVTNKLPAHGVDPLVIHADRVRTKQIVLNLLSNAVKYNRENGEIIIGCQHSGKHYLRLSISDCGMGIPRHKLEDLFKPFNRLGAENRNIEGTGIGLVIAKRLIEKMGGNIGVYSTEGEGATFWIEFKRPGVTAYTLPRASGITPIVRHDAIQSKKKTNTNARILVVEDNDTNRLLIENQLSKLGYSADIAATGAQGMELWNKHRYSLVLTDINLPDTSGIELARQIRNPETNRPDHTPIIAITANAQAGEKEKFLSAGMDDYIAKPIELAALKETLEKWLHDAKTNGETGGNMFAEQQVSTLNASRTATFNVDALSKYLGDDPLLHKKIAGSFLQKTPETLRRFSGAYQAKNRETIAMEAHKMSSCARTVGADAMAITCQSLEQSAEDSEWQKIGDLIARLHAQFEEVNHNLSAVVIDAANVTNPLKSAYELKVLAVDDDPLLLDHTICTLQRAGLSNIDSAVSGKNALDILSRKGIHDIDMILCDLNMPEMDGIEFLKHLAVLQFQGNIILISGAVNQTLQSAEQLARVLNLNILGALEKPLDRNYFEEMLEQYYKKVAAQFQLKQTTPTVSNN